MLLSTTLLLSGCFAQMQPIRPAVSATVIDAQDHKPLRGVNVSGQWSTSSSGRFDIPAEQDMKLVLPVSGVFAIRRSFTLSRRGYHSLHCECTTLTLRPACRDGEISMTKDAMAKPESDRKTPSPDFGPDGKIRCDSP